jgi:hypothetical protein
VSLARNKEISLSLREKEKKEFLTAEHAENAEKFVILTERSD